MNDAEAMRRALALAPRGRGFVQPNPLVGAVVVHQGEIVGEGWHAEHGGPHAEVAALAAAGERARGATLYVTLEPCAHHGKTAPCTEAILAAGIARVVFALPDPNRDAAGGAPILRRAGIDVVAGVEEAAAREQNHVFVHIHTWRRCYVDLKLAVSLDARIGEAGRRTQLTGPIAMRAAQHLRAGFDAIMVGANTARIDDPLLTVREVPVRVPPARVVLDTCATLPLSARLLAKPAPAPTVIVCADDAPADRIAGLEAAGARVVTARRTEGTLDIEHVLAQLWDIGIRAVLCEGGGRLAASLLQHDRIERLHLFVAPRFLGPAGVAAFPLATPQASLRWRLAHHEKTGDDVLLVLERRRED